MADDLDIQIGRNLRTLRKMAGYSQSEMAEHLCVTYQQFQKYETGANRISAGSLWRISQKLKVPMEMFLADGIFQK